MMNEFLPFALPDLGEEEITEVVNSLRSGWLTTGPKAKQFEAEFSAFIGSDVEAIAVNSATAGLHLALEAVGIGPGDEVITTPYTFTSTAEVIRYLGAHPIFVDISSDTLNLSPQNIEKCITNKTKAIIPVHFGGLACDMHLILDIAKRYNLHVIEDAAHALPTTVGGKIIGSLDSDATVFSFYATKTITTGEGGMIVTKNPQIAKRCKTMRLHGISRDVFDRYTSTKPAWHYEVVAPGYKYNMTDIAASIGIHQLKKAWKFQKKREMIAEYYNSEFRGLPVILPPVPSRNDIHAWHLYVLRLEDSAKIKRNNFIHSMAEKGIGCSVHFIPLHMHPYWREAYNILPEDYPNALDAFNRVVSLPIYTKMSEADLERVARSVKELLA